MRAKLAVQLVQGWDMRKFDRDRVTDVNLDPRWRVAAEQISVKSREPLTPCNAECPDPSRDSLTSWLGTRGLLLGAVAIIIVESRVSLVGMVRAPG